MRSAVLVGLVALVAVAAGGDTEKFTINPFTLHLEPGTDKAATFVLTVETGSEPQLKPIKCIEYKKEWKLSGIKVDGTAAGPDDFSADCDPKSNDVTVTIVHGKPSATTLNNNGPHTISGLTLTATTNATSPVTPVTVTGTMNDWNTVTYGVVLTLTVDPYMVKTDNSLEIKAEIKTGGTSQPWNCAAGDLSNFHADVKKVDDVTKTTTEKFELQCKDDGVLTVTFNPSYGIGKKLTQSQAAPHKVYGIDVWASQMVDKKTIYVGGTVKTAPVTTYDYKLSFRNDLPNELSEMDNSFALNLDLTSSSVNWNDYDYILSEWSNSTELAKGVLKDSTKGTVTFTFGKDKLKSGYQTFNDAVIKMEPSASSETETETYIMPFRQETWNTRVYDKNTSLSPAFDGALGTVDLTKNFIFKVCRVASAISNECTGVQFTEQPVFWNGAKSSKVQPQPQISTFDKINAEFTIDPTSEFMHAVAKVKEIGIGNDTMATPGSTWTPSFTSGSLIHTPYIVATQGTNPPHGTLHVELKEGYYHPEQDYSIDVIADTKNMTINIFAGSAVGSTDIPLTADDVSTAGNKSYAKTLKLLSSEDSEGLINMVSVNAVDLFVVDAAVYNLTADVTAPSYVTNVKGELNNTVQVKLDIAGKGVYPPVANYRVQILLNGTAQGNWVPSTSDVFDVDVSDLINSTVNGFLDVDVNYKATVMTTDGNLVDIVEPTQITNAANFTAVYAHTSKTNKDRVNPVNVSDANCNVDVNYTFVERTPALTSGSCYLKTDMNKTIWVKGKMDKKTKALRINGSLEFRNLVKNHLETFHCELDIDNDEAYWQLTQDMSSHKFTHYDANPLSSYKNETYVYNLVKSQKKLNCVGSYYGMVMANCTNGKSVNVTGNGAKWYYNANGTKVVYDKTVHNISSIIMDTCGSAAIFPAALVIAAVSLFNIFK